MSQIRLEPALSGKHIVESRPASPERKVYHSDGDLMGVLRLCNSSGAEMHGYWYHVFVSNGVSFGKNAAQEIADILKAADQTIAR
jgi:hypothetical protein